MTAQPRAPWKGLAAPSAPAQIFFVKPHHPSYMSLMDETSLPLELERYAAEAVADGRYRDRAEIVAAGVALLRARDAARAAFVASVLAAEEGAEREGCVSGDEMLARVRARLAEKRGAAR
jgi:Arc/MetJ-type ribon-helix-helix transcriptional regulator